MTRRVVASLALAVLLVSSGCSFLEGPVTFEANKSTVTEQARSDAGYTEARVEQDTITKTYSAAGQEKQVEVTNWIAEYKKQVSVGPLETGELARFTVLSTPQVSVLGQTFNPVADMSNAKLARMLQQEYSGISNVQPADNRSTTLLGEQTTVSRFTAEAETSAGQSTDVYIEIAKVTDGDDIVVALAVYPQQLDRQQAGVERMYQGVQHPTNQSSQ